MVAHVSSVSHLNVNWHQVQKFERGLVDLGVLKAQISGIWSGLVWLDLGRIFATALRRYVCQ